MPAGKPELLPGTLAKLEAGKALTIVYYGDSITEGYNASGTKPASAGDDYVPCEPFQPRYADLVTDFLEAVYPNADITEYNTALSGMDSNWGVENAKVNAADCCPDLVVLAFGMNDGTVQMSAADFCANLESIMATVLNENPDCEFVLVSTTLSNPDVPFFWGTQETFVSEMLKLEKPGAAVADMTTLHADLMAAKRFCDMTGNNVNHPNDFLGKTYAQLIFQTITGKLS